MNNGTKNDMPIMQHILGPSAPPMLPEPRSNSLWGRYVNNKHLEQINRSMELKASIMRHFVAQQEDQQKYIVNVMTAQQKVETMIAELQSRKTIALSAADSAQIDAMDKQLNFQLKREKIEQIGDGR